MARFVRFPGGGNLYTPESFTFDGVSGTFLSTPDINLLDADTSHIVQSVGQWRIATQIAEPLAYSKFAIQRAIVGTFNDLGTNSPSQGASIPVAASTQKTVAAQFQSDQDVGNLRLRLTQYRADQSQITSSDTNVSYVAPNPILISQTLTTAADAAFITIAFQGNTATDSTFKAWDIVMRTDTDSTFVPSLRIVGDIEMEAKASSPSSANQTLMATWTGSGSNGYQFGANLSGNLLARHGNGSVDRFASGSNALTPGVFQTVKGSFDAAGNWSFNIDGVSETVGPTTPGAASPSGGLSVGSNAGGTINLFTGDIGSAVVRDGIGGPTVASFDPEDYTGGAGAIPDGTTFIDSVTGRVWTANGNIVNVLAEFGNSIATDGLTVPSPVFIVKNPPAMPDIIDGDRWIIGNQWAGDGFTAQMHAGTDATGPIVAEFDAEDIGL